MSQEELKDLYERYYDRFYLMACRILKDEFAAKDVVQDVFISIYNKDLKEDASGYLANSIGNACRDYFKSRSYRKFVDTTDIEIGQEEMGLFHIEAAVLSKMYEQLDRLPPKAKATFLLYASGKKTKYIADKMNVSIQCVLNNKHYAIKLLKQSLQF